MIFNREERLLFTIKEFAHANKDLLIMVADPKTDRMFATYKDRFVNGRIKSPLGKKTHIVRDVLKYSRFHVTVDQFIASIVETLDLPIWKGGSNQFYQFLDGAVFNIAKKLRKNQPQDSGSPPVGAVKSPFVSTPEGRT